MALNNISVWLTFIFIKLLNYEESIILLIVIGFSYNQKMEMTYENLI
jgi:hypothetical protein